MRPGWGPIWVTSGTKIDGSRASEGAQRATGYQYHQNTSRNFISGPVSAVRGIPGGIAAEIHENLARMADFAPKWQILEIPSSNIPGPHCRNTRKRARQKSLFFTTFSGQEPTNFLWIHCSTSYCFKRVGEQK